jgi:hypothetical protein
LCELQSEHNSAADRLVWNDHKQLRNREDRLFPQMIDEMRRVLELAF